MMVKNQTPQFGGNVQVTGDVMPLTTEPVLSMLNEGDQITLTGNDVEVTGKITQLTYHHTCTQLDDTPFIKAYQVTIETENGQILQVYQNLKPGNVLVVDDSTSHQISSIDIVKN